jgi:hypothetical protein
MTTVDVLCTATMTHRAPPEQRIPAMRMRLPIRVVIGFCCGKAIEACRVGMAHRPAREMTRSWWAMPTLRLGVAVAISLCLPQFYAAGADFYVATDGSDDSPGTAAAPFATLTKARDAVRQKVKAGLDHDIVIQLGGGVYPQAETLVFGPEDSGTEKFSITYAAAPGEEVVVSGGRTISGWKRGKGHIWTAELPEVKEGKWYFRQLFVDGHRAIRARTPNAGQWWTMKPDGKNSDANDATIRLGVDHPIQAWKNVTDVEFTWLNNNDGTRKRIDSVRTSDNTFTLPPPHAWPHGMPVEYNINFPKDQKPCYFENALEMLDQPGEWYLDRQTGVLHYWPRKGESLGRAKVVAPMVNNTLLAIEGTKERPVRNVRFRGIRVAHVDWPLPPEGFTAMFGCLQLREDPRGPKLFYWIESAVNMKHARGCRFIDGAVEHAGAIGLAMRVGCTQNVIEGNEIADLGGGGIVAGWMRNRDTYKWADPVDKDDHKGHRIANNHIHDCGIDYFGSVGILGGPMQEAVIAHNLIHDISYTGIVLSGNEVGDPPQAASNRVEFNHIHHVMKVAQDGAAIYVSFPFVGRGAIMRGNLIHDTGHRGEHNGYCSGGLYTDGISGRIGPCANYRFIDNVVFHSDAPLMVPEKEFGTLLWIDNITYRGTVGCYSDAAKAPPPALLEAMESHAGLEPAYRRLLLGVDHAPCDVYRLIEESEAMNVWSAQQFHWPKRDAGVVLAFRRLENKEPSKTVRLQGLDPQSNYEVTGAGSKPRYTASGKTLLEQGLTIELDAKPVFTAPTPVPATVLKTLPAHVVIKYRKL